MKRTRNRPIPSGRVPGRWGLWVALAMSALSLVIGWQLGPWGFGATVAAVAVGGWIATAPFHLGFEPFFDGIGLVTAWTDPGDLLLYGGAYLLARARFVRIEVPPGPGEGTNGAM